MARRSGGFLSDFRKFLMHGNVVDLAVAVVIGGAFGKIITSLVEDIITPAILDPALKAARVENLQQLTIPDTGIKYGAFLAAVLSFLVVALCLFVIIRAFEQAKKRLVREEAVAEEAPDPAVVLQEQTAVAIDRLARALEARNL
ncbi:large conductance mechanosensitive channel protein MscL [Leptolyngbya sp. FACHB-36]|uniref:large conductance mechanosensitive channel protein MscL n=1 Tax=Leptolyngbya sp. FACHB-36 TaxID=2692808 RepID=UPI00168116EC|nr:large conductance mechanosensitive channel protein MscL [Leptolyngbya sp. FACHB-36]MBD2022251.1 large conductance mechanosensitive channel protein MscL [Leptolyngbya sp. FACHB-36]